MGNVVDSSVRLLYGNFPRWVGLSKPDGEGLWQFPVTSILEFEEVVNSANGIKNVYSSISAVKPLVSDGVYQGNVVEVDKVYYDFDSNAKADREDPQDWKHPLIPSFADDREVFDLMRDDPAVLDAVLGVPCQEARILAEESMTDGIPVVGVFSGFGIHLYQLYEPIMREPKGRVQSTANKYITELDLQTADDAVVGDHHRITRVPNVSRVDHNNGGDVGIYTVPLTPSELVDMTPEWLVSVADQPRPELLSEPEDRPKLKLFEEYVATQADEDNLTQEDMHPIPEESNATEFAKQVIKDVVRMPCVYEHAFAVNPLNAVRVKLGIMMLNAGMTVTECDQLIRDLGWSDYDSEFTRYQLKKLRQSGRGDWSCRTMRSKGLCVHGDEPETCPTYGYKGGNTPLR